MTRDALDHLDDMVTYARRARDFVSGMSWEDFREDVKTQLAVRHALLIVGEAAKAVPDVVRERYPDVPWREVVGMRNKLAHEYSGVNLRAIYLTARDGTAPLLRALGQ